MVETDWLQRFLLVLGAGGFAAVIVAFGRFRLANATARKTDAETASSQFVLIIDRLQTESAALSNRLEVAQQREGLVTVSKHEALKQNQAMIFHIQDLEETIALHNHVCKIPISLHKFKFTLLSEILRQEDEVRIRFAAQMKPVET